MFFSNYKHYYRVRHKLLEFRVLPFCDCFCENTKVTGVHRLMFIGVPEWKCVCMVVGDRLVTVNKSWDIEVRLVHTSQVVHTIRTGDDRSTYTTCITPVPGHSELIVTGHADSGVHLWNVGDKGTCANI